MGKIADALERRAKDEAMGGSSGRIATIVNTDLQLWVSVGNKEQRDEVSVLYPDEVIKWGPKAQLGKFIHNVMQFDKVPFVVVKLGGRLLKFTY